NANGNYRDEFNSASYSNSNGSARWTTNWAEANDDNNVAGGDIQVTGSTLQFNAGLAGDETLTRALDLSGAQSATVTFSYTEAMDSGENIVVEAWNGSVWQQIGSTILGSAMDGSGTFTANLTAAQIGAHSQIRFSVDGGWEGSDLFTVNDFNVAFT